MSSTQPLSEHQLLRLQAYIDGEATAAEIASFEEEMAENPALAAELERWLALIETVSPEFLNEIEPQFDAVPAVLARLELDAPAITSRYNGVVIVQIILGAILVLFGWPLVAGLQPQGVQLATAAGVSVAAWLNQLAIWINIQQAATRDLFSGLDLSPTFLAGPEMITTLLILAAIGGLIWLLSIRYILRTTDWRPVSN